MINTKTALVLYYYKTNRFSFNPLLGALEQKGILDNLAIYFFNRPSEMISRIGEVYERHRKVIVAISFFTPQLWEIADLLKSMKNLKRRNLLLVAGGPHPSGDAPGALLMGFDVVVRGEGEETFLELLTKVINDEDYREIQGISFIDDRGQVRFTGKRQYIDLNSYPPFPLEMQKFGPIEITRGCPYICSFCQTAHIKGSFPRYRSIDNIGRYVEEMARRGMNYVRFITPNAFSYGSYDGKTLVIEELDALFKRIRQTIGPKGKFYLGSFPSEVRPNHVTPETVELVQRYADNDNVVIGAQSGSDRILGHCRRGHTVEDIYRAVDLVTMSGLKCNVDFIFGLPDETTEDIQATVKVMEDLVKKGAIIHAHTFMPLPQTTFGTRPPGRTGFEMLKIVHSLVPKGVLFGNWKKQEEMAVRISEYLKTGKLKQKNEDLSLE